MQEYVLAAVVFLICEFVTLLLLYLFYRRNLTTQIFLRLIPGLLVVAILSYAVGQYTIYNYTISGGAFVVCLLALFISFALLGRGLTIPLSRIIYGLTTGAEQSTASSGQVLSASESLAQVSSDQAASLEESSSSLEEMSSMTRQNADNANHANNLMKESKQIVSRANESMNDLIRSMNDITKASEETSKIIKTIDEIAFQTNLLALNAAVEAARAGEAGAGFAVVANEVRNLAMRAAEASRNTAGLIEGTLQKVKEGAGIVTETSDAFTEVADTTSKVYDLIDEIATASNEQAQGIEQINRTMTELDEMTQKNAANAEETFSASEELNAQSGNLKSLIDELQSLVGETRYTTDESNIPYADEDDYTSTPLRRDDDLTERKKLEEKSRDLDLDDDDFVTEDIDEEDTRKRFPQKAVGNKGKQISPEQIIPLQDDDLKDF